MLKKVFALLLCLVTLSSIALADVEVAFQPVGRQILGQDEDAVEATMMRLSFTGGDEEIPDLYVLTESPWLYEENGGILMEDVNFDGYNDLVLVTMAGASNTVFTFYLWNEETGAFEWYGGEGIWNYQLYPAQGVILSTATSGWAGLLHESRVYAWDDACKELQLLRISQWDTLHETVTEQNGDNLVFTERYDDSVIVETYTDFENETEYSESHPSRDYQEDDVFAAQRFQAEDEFLGLEITEDFEGDGSNG